MSDFTLSTGYDAAGVGCHSLSFHRLRSPSSEGHQSGRSGQWMSRELKMIVTVGKKSCHCDEPLMVSGVESRADIFIY